VIQAKKLAILVGGGPAPGINSVISAATIRCQIDGVEVVGIRDGFEWLMQGNVEHVVPLTIERVSRIHFRGGSYIGISRASTSRTSSSRCSGSTCRSSSRSAVTIRRSRR
jgi:6-phosphofructokinase